MTTALLCVVCYLASCFTLGAMWGWRPTSFTE